MNYQEKNDKNKFIDVKSNGNGKYGISECPNTYKYSYGALPTMK